MFEHRLEYRDEIARRGIDDLQHLGGSRLPSHCLIALGVAFSKLALEVDDHLPGICYLIVVHVTVPRQCLLQVNL